MRYYETVDRRLEFAQKQAWEKVLALPSPSLRISGLSVPISKMGCGVWTSRGLRTVKLWHVLRLPLLKAQKEFHVAEDARRFHCLSRNRGLRGFWAAKPAQNRLKPRRKAAPRGNTPA